MNILINILTVIPRLKLYRNIRRKTRAAQETLGTLREEKTKSLQYGTVTFSQLSDVGIYLVIASVDLTVLHSRQLLECNDMIKNVYSRHLILLIYELMDDFPALFDKRLRAATQHLSDGERYLKDFEALSKTIRAIRKQHTTEFYNIRNAVVAHRDMDGTKQIESLNAIDHKTIHKLALEIDLWISQAMVILTRMVEDYSLSPLQLREIARKLDEK